LWGWARAVARLMSLHWCTPEHAVAES
jgi:hypothetical protein